MRMRQLWIRVFGWAATLIVACGFAAGVAQAQQSMVQQRMVPIPPKAQRADIIFNRSPDVLINGKAARLAPGARIFNQQNLIVMYSALQGAIKAKFVLEDSTGLVLSVWILTEDEIAAPDPRP